MRWFINLSPYPPPSPYLLFLTPILEWFNEENIMFFELRQYRIKPGQMDKFVKLMEEKIIPFQVAKGMVVIGSFVGQEETDLYVWIRRFENEAERVRLYDEVYKSDFWANEVKPQVDLMLDRERMVVTRIQATPKSVIQ